MAWPSWEMPRHQPIATRKTYSRIRSKRPMRGIRTHRSIAAATTTIAGSAAARRRASGAESEGRDAASRPSRMTIAMTSWSSSTLMTISPACRWCSVVVGSSFNPMIVLREHRGRADHQHLGQGEPNASATAPPAAANTRQLARVTTVASRTIRVSF